MQNTITISFVSSITLQEGYILSITGLQGADSDSRMPNVILKDSSGGCQHQNLFAASLNSSIRGTATWEAGSGTLQTVIVSPVLKVLGFALPLSISILVTISFLQQLTYAFSFVIINPSQVQVFVLGCSC